MLLEVRQQPAELLLVLGPDDALPAYRRVRREDLISRWWPRHDLTRTNLPVPVTPTRFWVPLWVFILGTLASLSCWRRLGRRSGCGRRFGLGFDRFFGRRLGHGGRCGRGFGLFCGRRLGHRCGRGRELRGGLGIRRCRGLGGFLVGPVGPRARDLVLVDFGLWTEASVMNIDLPSSAGVRSTVP